MRIGLGYLYEHFFRNLILQIQAANPDWQIGVVSGDTPALEQKLREKEIDIALIQKPFVRGDYDCLDFDYINTIVVVNRKLVEHIQGGA